MNIILTLLLLQRRLLKEKLLSGNLPVLLGSGTHSRLLVCLLAQMGVGSAACAGLG